MPALGVGDKGLSPFFLRVRRGNSKKGFSLQSLAYKTNVFINY